MTSPSNMPSLALRWRRRQVGCRLRPTGIFAGVPALFATGKGRGGRDLGLMSEVAKNEFSYFSEEERRALHDYLVKAE